LGYGQFTATQLKILQEVISISVFLVFGFFYLNEKPTWRTGLAFLLILAAVWLALSDRSNVAESPPPPEGSETNVSR
jgi:uncharacterized protein (DUF486 family)